MAGRPLSWAICPYNGGRLPTARHKDRLAGVWQKIGMERRVSDRELAALIEKRLPVSSIEALVRSGLSEAEVYRLIIPRRTLAHRISRREPLSREESDRVVRVARITAMAEQVFGDPDRAWRWLRKAKRSFEGGTPMDLLSTEAGARVVEEILARIDYGLAA